MKRIQNRLGSLCMAVVMLLSMAVTPAMAADTQNPPTTAPTVSQGENYSYHKYAIDFTYANSDWVGKISKIEINGEEWARVNSGFSIKEKTYQILESDGRIRFGDGFAAEEVQCKIEADGYKPLCLKINTANKTAEIVQDSSDSNGGSGSETPETPTRKQAPELTNVKANSHTDNKGFLLSFGAQPSVTAWLNSIKTVKVNGLTYGKVTSAFDTGDTQKYVIRSNGQLGIGEGYQNNPARCVINADGYEDMILVLNKTDHTAYIAYTVTAAGDLTNGTVSFDKSKNVKPGTQVTVTAKPETGYVLDTLTVKGRSGTVEVTRDPSNANVCTFTMPAEHVTVSTTFKLMPVTYNVTVASDIKNGQLKVTPTTAEQGDTVTVTATPENGFELDKLTVTGISGAPVTVTNNQFTMPAENVTVSAAFKEIVHKTVAVRDIVFGEDRSGSDWYVTFGTESENYIKAIKGVSVNGEPWEEGTSTTPSTGGSYCKYNYSSFMSNTKTLVLAFAQKKHGSGPDVLKSGDIITITAEGYNDLTFKLVIDQNGNATVSEDTTPGDIYQLHVKIEGSFEAAIVGQKKYDGVSSATTGGASGNKNSSVTVYGALVKKGTDPTDKDWEKLDYWSDIKLKGSSVSIVPDTEKGTSESADSGMEGVYMKTSSDLTLDGTPKDEGSYLISISVTDNQGRTATSNTLPFRIYTGEETLADQLKTENLKKYESSDLYAWDIMEPWAIKNFGSNVKGQNESVRVPEKLEVWFGSHTSGTYGFLGYDIPWKQVKAGDIPQTLYIPDGCDLTLTNMEVLSSVRIVVEDGGKLTLSDSVVQGIIDVKSGGTFSMNYDAFNKKFTTGASICGQLRMEGGSTLENAAIYSHTNYLANGDLTDRSNDEAVVLTTGDVTVKGQVFISGDEAGSTGEGQTALKVQNGTLTLEDGAVLATYGGGGNVTLFSNGGSAIKLDNGTISGNGKVIALGGSVLFGSGNSAVSGTGTITTAEAYIQGATAYNHAGKNAQPGKSHDASVAINSGKKYIANGTLVDGAANDPLADLYWKTGIQETPDLSKYAIAPTPGYVLMNIPYNAFYAAEKDDNDTAAQVDAVSSATKSKPLSSLAANSYHNNSDGSDISGITYPVHVSDLSALRGYKQVKDSDTLTITVTLRGKETTTTYKGKDTLFGAPDYAYYVLSAEETPTSFKELTVSNGTLSFGKATAKAVAADGVTVSLTTNGHHTYYEMKVAGLAEDIANKVSAVTLHTTDGNVYGLRHVVEIWRGTELGFGVDSGLQGKTIDTITYYLNDGTIQTIAANIKVPKSTQNVTATVENALNTAGETTITVTDLPTDFVAAYAVTSGNTDLSEYNFAVENGKLRWTGEPAFGTYTLTITDAKDIYAPVSTTFELKTADIIAKYDASKKALVKASDAITEEQFAAYLKAISAVSVDGTSYAASGRGAVTIVKTDGVIDLTAQPFSKGEGASYSLVVKAAGYQDLTFTVEVPKQNGDSSSSSSSGGGGGSSSDRDNSGSGPVKTETTKNNDGSTTRIETKKDGTKIQTVTGKDGSVSKTETKKDGSSVTENKAADGSTGTVKTDKNGKTEAAAKLSDKAVSDAKKNGEPVKAPVEVEASRNSNTAPTVKIELPRNSGETKVEIPVSNVKPGTVAVLVKADGTEEILKNSLPTEDGIQLTINGGATVKIVDNSKDFADTRTHWAKDAIDFVSARGLVNGMNESTFSPNAPTTRAQLWTILARQNDANLTGGNTWFENAQNWAKEKGISDGANPNGTINRAQMVAMLWRAMGEPAAVGGASFADVPADSYYARAVAWAVENGITAGVGGGRFDPNATCTRGQIAAFLYRYMK